MQISYFDASTADFLALSTATVLGELARHHHHDLDQRQRNSWISEIIFLKSALEKFNTGHLFLEFSIPRMGKRADAVLLCRGTVFVIEFKVGSEVFDVQAIEQVHDYALDLKNFHLGSRTRPIVPVLVATKATRDDRTVEWANDGVASPVLVGSDGLSAALSITAPHAERLDDLVANDWAGSGYRPTPTIIEAAEALYQSHNVEEISRSDAGAKNLRATSAQIGRIVDDAKTTGKKSICFITGVPGSGKTLAGLNIAARRAERYEDEHAVFLSGNGPLVDVLREALARDQVAREGHKKTDAKRAVRRFIQNIHHFRDYYVGTDELPFEKVVVFDEAQRAWTSDQASKFMKTRRGLDNFDMSEPEFLISVMDRHVDWCTIICLIGGGQEINSGEAGLAEWLSALQKRFPDWSIHASSLLEDREYTVDGRAAELLAAPHINIHSDLHLSVSMRSFRAEQLSTFVHNLLEGDADRARTALKVIQDRYPIVLTRNIDHARDWLRTKARGSERFGLIASSGAYRLRPEGVQVKAKIDPATWFLNDRRDVRSSFYLEEVATQFDIQGLELDWVGVCWDADLRYLDTDWQFHAFKGTKWQQVRDETKRLYLLNAYRVLLTRARQGMVICVPRGDATDWTRPPEYYDETYGFLRECGVRELGAAAGDSKF